MDQQNLLLQGFPAPEKVASIISISHIPTDFFLPKLIYWFDFTSPNGLCPLCSDFPCPTQWRLFFPFGPTTRTPHTLLIRFHMSQQRLCPLCSDFPCPNTVENIFSVGTHNTNTHTHEQWHVPTEIMSTIFRFPMSNIVEIIFSVWRHTLPSRISFFLEKKKKTIGHQWWESSSCFQDPPARRTTLDRVSRIPYVVVFATYLTARSTVAIATNVVFYLNCAFHRGYRD